MIFGTTFFIVAGIIIAIWILLEAKRLQHKIIAIFLIGLVLFGYISFTTSLKDEKIDFKTIPGIIHAVKIYSYWMGNLFKNARAVTAYAAKQNWTDTTPPQNSSENSIWDKL